MGFDGEAALRGAGGERLEQLARLRRVDSFQNFHSARLADLVGRQGGAVEAVEQIFETALGFQTHLGELCFAEVWNGHVAELFEDGRRLAAHGERFVVQVADPAVDFLGIGLDAVRWL